MTANPKKETGRFIAFWLLLGTAALFLPGCWLFGGEPSGMPEKVFGVYNAFPEHPQYVEKKIQGAGLNCGTIGALHLKSRLSLEAIRFLEAKGYRAVAVESPSALEDGTVDILIQMQPVQVIEGQGLAGYGFSGREILWGLVKQRAASFVAMQVSMKRRFSSRVIIPRFVERFSDLGGQDLPESWDRLSVEEQEAFERNLTENMAKAVYLSLSRLKI